MNMDVQQIMWPDIEFFEFMPRSGIAGEKDNSSFDFIDAPTLLYIVASPAYPPTGSV